MNKNQNLSPAFQNLTPEDITQPPKERHQHEPEMEHLSAETLVPPSEEVLHDVMVLTQENLDQSAALKPNTVGFVEAHTGETMGLVLYQERGTLPDEPDCIAKIARVTESSDEDYFGDEKFIVTTYAVSQSDKGELSLSKHIGHAENFTEVKESLMPSHESEAVYDVDSAEVAVDGIGSVMSKLGAQALEAEMGLDFVSELEAHELCDLLEEAQPLYDLS